MSSSTTSSAYSVLVLGGTGATGGPLINLLLQRGVNVHAVVRNRDRLLQRIGATALADSRLAVTEATLLDMDDAAIDSLLSTSSSVVQCLGHNLTFGSIFWPSHSRLCRDTVRRVAESAARTRGSSGSSNQQKEQQPPPPPPLRFVLMNSVGVHCNATDARRSFGDRCLLTALRWMFGPHKDNEEAATELETGTTVAAATAAGAMDWTIVRPDELIDEVPTPAATETTASATATTVPAAAAAVAPAPAQPLETPFSLTPTPYTVMATPQSPITAGFPCLRVNVAAFMRELVTDDAVFAKWRRARPVIYDTREE